MFSGPQGYTKEVPGSAESKRVLDLFFNHNDFSKLPKVNDNNKI